MTFLVCSVVTFAILLTMIIVVLLNWPRIHVYRAGDPMPRAVYTALMRSKADFEETDGR